MTDLLCYVCSARARNGTHGPFFGEDTPRPVCAECTATGCCDCGEAFVQDEMNDGLLWHVVDNRLFCWSCAAWCRDCGQSRVEAELISDGNVHDDYTYNTCMRHEHECSVCDGVVTPGTTVTDPERPVCSDCSRHGRRVHRD